MRLAIVGAGPAGLAAAYALRDADVAVTVFEKSRGVSGRAATRWRDAPALGGRPFRWRYDHGAQYLSPEAGSDVARLIREVAGDALVEIEGAVWPFDDDGTLRPDRARPEAGLRWTLRDGIADLGRRLADATPGLDLRLQTRVAGLTRDGATWTIEVEGDDPEAGFDAVLVTAPAPQAAGLLRASRLGGLSVDPLVAALTEAEYRSQFSVVWAFDRPVDRPDGVYALVNATEHGASGGGHAVAWLAVESDKPNRAPAGASLLIAQMAPAWTETHYDDDRADVVAAATEAVAGLLGALPDPLWTDTQRWRYALPNSRADTEALQAASGHGLFFAGDFTAAKGRVHLALEEGTEAARRIAAA